MNDNKPTHEVYTFSEEDLSFVNNGAFGTYYTIKSDLTLGIKLIKNSFKSSVEYYESVEKEFNMLQQLYLSYHDLVPKPYHIVYMHKTGNFGYMMEHIPMKALMYHDDEKVERCSNWFLSEILRSMFLEDGFILNDLHTGNILYDPCTGNFKVIDFDPRFIGRVYV